MAESPSPSTGRVKSFLLRVRHDAEPFNDKQIALIKAFADQAVIAVENVRLFD
jgi:GAF domain-containing protein